MTHRRYVAKRPISMCSMNFMASSFQMYYFPSCITSEVVAKYFTRCRSFHVVNVIDEWKTMNPVIEHARVNCEHIFTLQMFDYFYEKVSLLVWAYEIAFVKLKTLNYGRGMFPTHSRPSHDTLIVASVIFRTTSNQSIFIEARAFRGWNSMVFLSIFVLHQKYNVFAHNVRS